MANICCPAGYGYNSGTQLCVATSSSGATTAPLPCTCCAQGLTYISSTGYFFNTYAGIVMQVTDWTGGAVEGIYNKCVFTQAAPSAYGPAYEPSNCPCCPEDYIYSTQLGLCIQSIGGRNTVDPIPCLVCDPCSTTPPPPLPCEGCQSQYLHTSFAFNPSVKACIDCTEQGEPRISNDPKLNAFLPYFIFDPVINFRLDL